MFPQKGSGVVAVAAIGFGVVDAVEGVAEVERTEDRQNLSSWRGMYHVQPVLSIKK